MIELLKYPITGIAACCARAASGHAAAPPSSVMNLRRRHHSITSSARASSVGGMVEAERLGGLEVDHQLELGWLQNRKIGRFLALEDSPGVSSGLPIAFGNVRSVAHQTAGLSELALLVDRGD